MKRSIIKEEILRAVYLAWNGHTDCPLDQLRETHGWDKNLFVSVVKELEDEDLISHHAQWDYRIFARGAQYVEKQHLVPNEKSHPHKQVRKKILKALAEFRQKEGEDKTIYYEKLCESAQIDKQLFLMNERILRGLGYIEMRTIGHYRITSDGLRLVF